jgi:hypothetical protein
MQDAGCKTFKLHVTAQQSRLFIYKHPLLKAEESLCFIGVFCFYSEELLWTSKHSLPKAEESLCFICVFGFYSEELYLISNPLLF